MCHLKCGAATEKIGFETIHRPQVRLYPCKQGRYAITVLRKAVTILVKSRVRAHIALGANEPSAIGAPLATLEEALRLLAESGARPVATSRWRRSAAFPPGSGPDFVNGAATVETALAAGDLLAVLHDVERRLGRERRKRWGPRVCDLDLLAYGETIAPDPDEVERLMALGDAAGEAPPPDRMILPHPRMHERAFVLAPLADIAPDWRHPLLGQTVREMLGGLDAERLAEIEVIDV